jgi:SRSO17 transposase
MTMSKHDMLLERLDDFIELFRDDFRRRDQLRWAAVYLQGLLHDGDLDGPKTIGTLARHVTLPGDLVVEDVAQALQNFVNQSPWDERKVWRRHRRLLAETLAVEHGYSSGEGVFVLEDLAFPKQGRHSVGVQRQYSGTLGRKTNCQIAVALYHVGPSGFCPLLLRLYLPRGWLQQPARLNATGVPEEYRLPQTRAGIALELLDTVRGELPGWSARTVVVGSGISADPDFRMELTRRGLTYLIELGGTDDAGVTAEGEAHVADERGQTILTTIAPDEREDCLRRWASYRGAVAGGRLSLMDELGLDHFEGRSWRGFHHHACLVMLAFGFRLLPNGARTVDIGPPLGL